MHPAAPGWGSEHGRRPVQTFGYCPATMQNIDGRRNRGRHDTHDDCCLARGKQLAGCWRRRGGRRLAQAGGRKVAGGGRGGVPGGRRWGGGGEFGGGWGEKRGWWASERCYG